MLSNHLPPEVMQPMSRPIPKINNLPIAELIEVREHPNDNKIAIQNILSIKETLRPTPPIVFTSLLPSTEIETTVTASKEKIIQRDLQIADCKKDKEELGKTLEQIAVIIDAAHQEREALSKTFLAIQRKHQDIREEYVKWQEEVMDFYSLCESGLGHD